MSNKTFWKAGSIVKLQTPYKPSEPSKSLLAAISGTNNAYHQRQEYNHHWQGFTHGIIVQVYAHDHQGKPSNVSLHLYDPERCVIYYDGMHGIPSYVDYGVSELIPVKDGAVIGYEIVTRR